MANLTDEEIERAKGQISAEGLARRKRDYEEAVRRIQAAANSVQVAIGLIDRDDETRLFLHESKRQLERASLMCQVELDR